MRCRLIGDKAPASGSFRKERRRDGAGNQVFDRSQSADRPTSDGYAELLVRLLVRQNLRRLSKVPPLLRDIVQLLLEFGVADPSRPFLGVGRPSKILSNCHRSD